MSTEDKPDDKLQLPAEIADFRTPWGWKLPVLSKDQARWLDSWFARRGLSAAEASPRICGPNCSFQQRCPLESLQIPLPIGCPCPVETKLLDMFIIRMRRSLGIEDEDVWSQMLIEYGAMWNLLLQRAMSEERAVEVAIESYRGIDKEGNALYERKVNPLLMFARDVQRILQSIGKDLVATKEARLRLSQHKPGVGPEEALQLIEAQFKVSDEEVESKSQKIRDKKKKPSTVDPDRPSVPHVNTDALRPKDA